MKVLLINGSPHANGCTYTALSEVARALEGEGIETEILHIGSGPVRGCIGCGGCARKGDCRCIFGDDRVNEALEKMDSCQGLVIGSPVHYASAGGSITSFMDRMFYAGGKRMRGKVGAVVASAREPAQPPRRSAQQVLLYQRYACGPQPILAHGARQHCRRSAER